MAKEVIFPGKMVVLWLSNTIKQGSRFRQMQTGQMLYSGSGTPCRFCVVSKVVETVCVVRNKTFPCVFF